MLKLVDIRKTYIAGTEKVEALKGVSVNFRKNEFVSILGPSGCGKTTLLNLIGGLDKYTSGDLVINGVSTKRYKDHDWDVYRNHRIGFIFQSYNLIPHQTVLQNVELALTIAGLDKNERTRRAKVALERVGLGNQGKKRPNQLSGGQCQRVAIARALVNEPEILLADEPTGALDTQTSKQIMDLIKDISKEKLVIMVTHNPDIALEYSSRIVRLLDGEICDDTNPCSDEEELKELTIEVKDEDKVAKEEKEKAKMSMFTAFRLSFRNLLSKFKRTLMVGLAGSIGIIGVSCVLALSSGINDYIDNMQEDMLSGNPITITEQTYDLNALTNTMSEEEKDEVVIKSGVVNVNSILNTLAERANAIQSIMVSNDINQNYIDYIKQMPSEWVDEISLGYGINVNNNIYTSFSEGSDGLTRKTSISAIKQTYTKLLTYTEFKDSASYLTTLGDVLSQSISNPNYIEAQYNVLAGKIATEKDEIMIVVSSKQELTDLLLAQLGYYSEEEFLNLAFRSFESEDYNEELDKDEFTFNELLDKKFYYYPNDSVFELNTNAMTQMAGVRFNYNAYADELTGGLELKVVGILQAKDNVSYGTLSSGFYFTEALTNYMLEVNKNSEIVNYLKDNELAAFNDFTDMTNLNIVAYQYDYFDQFVDNIRKTETGYVLGNVSIASYLTGGSTGSLGIRDLAGNDLANSISIYPVDFELKENVLDYLDKWNKEEDITVNGTVLKFSDRSEIKYTDTLSLVIDLISTMIKAVTVSLIVFTAISLVVSTVMIGIITYVSVVERTKEIGVIRSLGGRKKDVGHLFNAETFIIGFVAGLLGIGITYLLSLIGNIIIGNITGIYTLCHLRIGQAIIMVLVSVALTLISGLIPSRAAARMDPVNALRTE